MKRVSVVGLGKLGLALAAVLADSGFSVTGIELDKSKVESVNEGKSPLYEPGLDELIRKNHKRLTASATFAGKVAGTDATFVVVPTPSEESGAFSTDLVAKAMESVGRELARKRAYHLVVLTSTVGPGSMDGVVRPALERASGRKLGPSLGLCYNPEFIALGDVIRGLRSPDFILIGESDKKAGDLLASIQRAVCTNSPPMERMEFVNAELAKIALNSFVTMKMSFANTLAEIAERLPGGDVDKVTGAIGRDRRVGGAYLKGATGYGGTCLVEGTLVHTDSGLVPIQEVVPGALVLSHDGSYHRVTKAFSRYYEGDVITIIPEGALAVTVTPEHPVLGAPRFVDEETRCIDVPGRTGIDGYSRNSHRLRSMTGLKSLPVSWRSADQVKHGDLSVFPIPRFPSIRPPILDLRPYHKRPARSNLPVHLPLSPGLARLFGYYISEGSTWHKEVRLSLHRDDQDLIVDVVELIKRLGYKSRVKDKGGNGVDVVFACAPLARYMRETFGSRAPRKHLPQAWLGLDEVFRVELLRGILYGDGSTSGSEYALDVTSRQLANQVYLILLSLGIAATFRSHPAYTGKDGVHHRESYFVRVRHPREAEKLAKLLPLMPISRRRTTNKKTVWIEDGLLYRHVRGVERTRYRGMVHNLEVETANSYCSEGSALHNCFPRDNLAFAHYAGGVGAQALIAEATHEVNLSQPARLVAHLKRKSLTKRTRVGVLGLSFKPNTNIVEQSQALMIVKLLADGGSRVTVYDPAAIEGSRAILKGSVEYAGSAEELVRKSDLIILATPWPQFASLDPKLFKAKDVFDCWRFFGPEVRRASRYSSVGTA